MSKTESAITLKGSADIVTEFFNEQKEKKMEEKRAIVPNSRSTDLETKKKELLKDLKEIGSTIENLESHALYILPYIGERVKAIKELLQIAPIIKPNQLVDLSKQNIGKK